MIKIEPPIRVSDRWGQGHYGAPRGSRTHKGIDFCCEPGSKAFAYTEGIVTKLGYPYDDDEDHDGKPDFNYVEITDLQGNRCRYFYVTPEVKLNEHIFMGKFIGKTQKLGKKYPGITEHLHFEIIGKDGKHFDPRPYLGLPVDE